MNDVTDRTLDFERLIPLAAACHLIPGRPHVSTIWRWCRVGINGERLRYVKIGKRIFTSSDALNQFFTALAAADKLPSSVGIPATKRCTPAARQKAIERARNSLKEAGI